MKHLGLILSLSFILATPSFGGGEVRNGGHVCKKKGAKEFELCDRYHQERASQYTRDQRFGYKDIPIYVKMELDLIAKVLRNRSFGKVDIWEIIKSAKEIRYYNVKEFSGEDDQHFGDDVESRQVGYAYEYNVFDQKHPDKRTVRKVVELDVDFLTELGPRKFALALVHEWLHLEEGYDHGIISPFIAHLDYILEIYDRQKAGDRRRLTQREIGQLTTFQAILVQLTTIQTLAQQKHNPYTFEKKKVLYYTLDTFNRTRIHPMGGGALLYEEKITEFPEKHFIGVLASVKGITVGQIYRSKESNLEVLDEITILSERTAWIKTAYVDWKVGLETVKDAGENVNLSGKTALISRCIEFDNSGVCKFRQAFVPMELGLSVGDDSRLNNLSLSVFGLSGENNNMKPVQIRCNANFGNFRMRELRSGKGRFTNMNAIDGKCRFSMKNNKMGIHIELGTQVAPLMFYGLGHIKNSQDNRYNGFGFSIGGQSLIGASVENFDLDFFADGTAFFSDGKLDDSEVIYKHKNYGMRAKYKINEKLYLQGHVEKIINEFSLNDLNTGGNISKDSSRENFIGLSVGGSHDFLTR